MFKSHEVLMLLDECLHVDEQWIERIVDIAAFYHGTPHLELFSDYKIRDFCIVKMENSNHYKIIWISDVCFETNVGVKVDTKRCKKCSIFMP